MFEKVEDMRQMFQQKIQEVEAGIMYPERPDGDGDADFDANGVPEAWIREEAAGDDAPHF